MSRALAWNSLLRVLTRTAAVVTTVVVARSIPPEEYGVFAAILIAHQLISTVGDVSVKSALMQMAHDAAPYVPTARAVEFTKGAVVFAILFISAGWWCNLLGVPQATPMLQVLAGAQLLMGVHNLGVYLLRRELRYGPVFVLYATEVVVYSVTAIVGVQVIPGAWALVVAMMLSLAVRTAMSYVVAPAYGGIALDTAKFREMFAFSKWVSAHGAVDVILDVADNAVVGRVIGPLALGFYRIAYQLATEGSAAMHWVATEVAFAAVARVQLDLARVRRGLHAILGLTSAALAPVAVGLTMLGDIAVPLILGERWAPAVDPLRILALAALVRGVLDSVRPVLLGLGLSRADFGLRLTQVSLMLALIYPGALFYGMTGVAFAVLGAAIATLPVGAILVVRATRASALDLVRPLIAPAIAATAAVVMVALIPRSDGGWSDLAIHTLALVVTYGIFTLALMRFLPWSGLAVARRSVT